MLIYFSMIIPVITALVLYAYWKHKTVWWEFLIPTAVSLFLCFIMKTTVEAVQTSDTEWWTGAVLTAEYYEDWDERVSCRHPKYKQVRKSDGTYETVQDGYEHAYDVDYHPPYWQVNDSNGLSVWINQGKFHELVYKFGNKQWVNLHRNYHSKNGNKYVATWDGSDERCEVCTTTHRYKNRLLASNSVFKFPEPSSKDGLYEYPIITGFYQTPFILGNAPDYQKAERKLSIWNARYGKEKQCRMSFLIYQNHPIDVALNQENQWQGGNKNEFLVAIGVDDEYKVQWCHVMSWTEQEVLKAEVKDYFIQQDKLNLVDAVDWVGGKVRESFVRKSFKDFDYLTVDPPTWTVFLTFFLTAAVNVGISFWVIKNEFADESEKLYVAKRW